MRKPRRIRSSSYAALACIYMVMNTGCETGSDDHASSSQVSLEIRFQDDSSGTQQPSAGLLRFASWAADPTMHGAGTTQDEVARILVDITHEDSGQPLHSDLELTELAPDVWRGNVPVLPHGQQLRFAARALDAAGDVAFSGETLATLTADNHGLQIPVSRAQDDQIFQFPRMPRIIHPAELVVGQEEQVIFRIQGNAGAAIGFQISASGSPDRPAPEFSPAAGTLALTGTVADLVIVYTAPEVTHDTTFDYQITLADPEASHAETITTDFRITVLSRPPAGGIKRPTYFRALFNPVILDLITSLDPACSCSEVPGPVELLAVVSDDSAPDQLTYQWSYAPDAGTPDATFANDGQGNPGLLSGFTADHQGTINLVVTDEHNGTTTLHYQLTPILSICSFAPDRPECPIKRIVAGDAHTCVLTGENRVRCWGDNAFGQLGYGNAIDVGDARDRLPHTAGDVPLPVFDPVRQLVAGNHHTCVLLQSGLIYCWGLNSSGQLGYNTTDRLGDGEAVTSFGFVTLGDLATRIAAGGDHTCAILRSGALRCWGLNSSGQLGRGNTANIGDNEAVFSAGDVDLGGVTVKDLALGGAHTCALLTTGAVRCWGRNFEGQLGYGHNQNLGDNEPINNLSNVSLTGTVRKLVAGDLHTCALTFAGTLRCWGRNIEGQLGQSFPGFFGIGTASGNPFWGDNSGELPSTLPSDINTGSPVTDVAAGDAHACALSSDGQLKCWGAGANGRLGYGNVNNVLTPPVVGVNLDGVTAYRLSAGGAHTCALRTNGTARCWGANGSGQLGRGNTIDSPTATGNVDIAILGPPAP